MRFISIIQDMMIDVNESRLNTVAQLHAFLAGMLLRGPDYRVVRDYG